MGGTYLKLVWHYLSSWTKLNFLKSQLYFSPLAFEVHLRDALSEMDTQGLQPYNKWHQSRMGPDTDDVPLIRSSIVSAPMWYHQEPML